MREGTYLKTPHYVGSGQYCYANSLAMILAEQGAEYDPGYLECLTCVSISAFWEPDGFPFLSSRYQSPDTGIHTALKHLGYAFEHRLPASFEEGLEGLSELLQYGSVLIGPVDMGELSYIPNRQALQGVDHFVCVYGLDETYAYLHDPAGYPCMTMPLAALKQAWRAENIEYRKGSYSGWGNIRRINVPDRDELFRLTDDKIASILILERKDRLGRLSDEMTGHLSFFSFQLGARRALDYARFYQPYDAETCKPQTKTSGMVRKSS